MTTAVPETSARAGPREWIGLVTLALPCLVYSMDLTVLHLAVPQLTRDLAPSSAQLLWIIDIYGFMIAGALIPAGTLGDRVGRRKLLLIGAAAFAVASLLAARARSAEGLIAARAVLGLAGATIAPSTLSLIRNMFRNDQQRTVAISIWVTAFSLGGAIGPLIGGVLLEQFHWGSVFLIAIPVMVMLLVLGPWLLPEYRDPSVGHPDVVSALLSTSGIVAIIYGLKSLAQDGPSVQVLAAVVLGLAVASAFVRRQRRLADPLIDLKLFAVPGFTASLATYALAIVVFFGAYLFLPQFLQLVLGLSPLVGGLWTLPWTLAFIVGSLVTPMLARRIAPGRLMAGGLAIASIGYVMLGFLGPATSLAYFASATMLLAVASSPAFTLTTDLVVSAAPPERAGAAASLSETGAELGGALGIALFGSLGIAVYRQALGDVIPPTLSPEMADAARSTLAGALRVTGSGAAELHEVARTAFARGLRLSAWLAAVGSLALAIFVRATLVRPRGDGAD